MRLIKFSAMIIIIIGLLSGCGQLKHQNNQDDKQVAKAEENKTKSEQSTKEVTGTKNKDNTKNPIDSLTGDYRDIAILVRDYQLPKDGMKGKNENGFIEYENGYVFSPGGMLDSIEYVSGYKHKPTVGQYLGVVMGYVIDAMDEDSFDSTIDTSKETKEERIDTYYQSWNSHPDTDKPGDLDHKYMRLNEAIPYSQNYPVLQQKLKDIKATFEEAEKYGKSKSTIEKAISLYHQGCMELQKLYDVFQIGMGSKRSN